MSYYTTELQKGSQGDEVKKWQEFLNTKGYGLSVDGDFDDNTYNATIAYQKANGLASDGIVDKNTWAKAGYKSYYDLTTPASAPQIKSLPTATTYDTTSWNDTEDGKSALESYDSAKSEVNKYGDFSYDDYKASDGVNTAEDKLNEHIKNEPGEYQSEWKTQLNALMDSILNREKFSYDLNKDALYQQYKDQYMQQGKLAMEDTIGQAAAMTGGYGNSYAATVGNQAYQSYLGKLNDVVPELYQMALDRYNTEGQELYNRYGMLSERENLDYEKYRDNVSDYYTKLDYLTGRYDTESERDYSRYLDDRNMDYTMYSDEYSRLLDSLNIAQGDYYNGADMFYTEQSNKNNVRAQEFSDDMNIWNADADQSWKQAEWDESRRLSELDNYWNEVTFQENQKQNNIANEQFEKQFSETQKQNNIANEQWDKEFNAKYGTSSNADDEINDTESGKNDTYVDKRTNNADEIAANREANGIGGYTVQDFLSEAMDLIKSGKSANEVAEYLNELYYDGLISAMEKQSIQIHLVSKFP